MYEIPKPCRVCRYEKGHAPNCAMTPLPDPKASTMWSRLRQRVGNAIENKNTFYPMPEEWALLDQAMTLVENWSETPTILDDLPWKPWDGITANPPVNWRDLREEDEITVTVNAVVGEPIDLGISLLLEGHSSVSTTLTRGELETAAITRRERPLAVGDKVRPTQDAGPGMGLQPGMERPVGYIAAIAGDKAWVAWSKNDTVADLSKLERAS